MASSSNGWIPLSNVGPVVHDLRATFNSGKTNSLAWRREQLQAFLRFLVETRPQHREALKGDLGRNDFTFEIEYAGIVKETEAALASVADWVKPQKPSLALTFQPGSAEIRSQPRGVVLIIGAWNYPFQVVYKPLIGAIAAGNTILIKPSEVSVASDQVMRDILPRYLDTDAIKIASGGVAETTEILKQRFDYIIYTGGGMVGKLIMRAAAEHLTPVTLELGGKSPAIIDTEVALDVALHRIAWGRFLNCGQTCVAPDYVLVPRALESRVLEGLKAVITEFYGEDPRQSADYSRIVNAVHVARIQKLIEEGSHKVVCGGVVDVAQRYVAPTVLTSVNPADAVMQNEIFGPILPVIPVDSIDEAIRFVNDRPNPLALYIFSSNARTISKVIDSTNSGGVCVNDTVLHCAVPTLPFGGFGASGMGAYNGKYTFDLFSHARSVLYRPTFLDPDVRYPPYNPTKLRILTFLNGIKPVGRTTQLILLVVLVAVFYHFFGHLLF